MKLLRAGASHCLQVMTNNTAGDYPLYVTFEERLMITMHYESGDVSLALPAESGLDEIRYGSARVSGRRTASWGRGRPSVAGVQLSGPEEDLRQIERSLEVLVAAPLIESLRLSAHVVSALTGLRSAVTGRLSDQCWAVVLPDGRPVTAHWLRHDADADDSVEDAALDRYGVRCDESTAFRTVSLRWSELPEDIRS